MSGSSEAPTACLDGVVFLGHGMLRWKGFGQRAGDARGVGYKTILEGQRMLLEDPDAIGIDFARPRGGKYDCYLFYRRAGAPPATLHAIPAPGHLSFAAGWYFNASASASEPASPTSSVGHGGPPSVMLFRHDPYTEYPWSGLWTEVEGTSDAVSIAARSDSPPLLSVVNSDDESSAPIRRSRGGCTGMLPYVLTVEIKRGCTGKPGHDVDMLLRCAGRYERGEDETVWVQTSGARREQQPSAASRGPDVDIRYDLGRKVILCDGKWVIADRSGQWLLCADGCGSDEAALAPSSKEISWKPVPEYQGTGVAVAVASARRGTAAHRKHRVALRRAAREKEARQM